MRHEDARVLQSRRGQGRAPTMSNAGASRGTPAVGVALILAFFAMLGLTATTPARAQQTSSLEIVAPDTTGSVPPGGTFTATLTVQGGVPPYTLVTQQGTLTPSEITSSGGQATYSFTVPPSAAPGSTISPVVSVFDSIESSAQQTFTITVTQITALSVSPQQLQLSGAPGETVTGNITISGSVPPYSLSADQGSVTSSVSASGESATYSFAIPASAAPGSTFSATITVQSAPFGDVELPTRDTVTVPVTVTALAEPLTVTPSRLDLTGLPGESVSGDLTVTGGAPPYSLVADQGSVTSSISASGGSATYSFAIPANAAPGSSISATVTITDTAVDGQQQSVEVPVLISVAAQELAVQPASLALSGSAGQTVSAVLTVSGAVPPYSLTADQGSVTSSVATSGGTATYSFAIPATATPGTSIGATITITDSGSVSQQLAVPVTISVEAQALSANPASLTLSGTAGQTLVGSFSLSGGTPPYQITTTNPNATVSPATLAAPGEVSYSLPIPQSVTGVVDQVRVVAANGASLTIAVTANPLSGLPGLTPPQQAVAQALETLCPQLSAVSEERPLTPGEADLLAQCNTLLGNAESNQSGVVQGIAAITPEQASAPGALTAEVSNQQLTNIGQRLAALRHGATGISIKGLAFNVGGQSVSGGLLAGLLSGTERGGAAGDQEEAFSRLGIFVNGNVDFGNRDRTVNQSGFDFDTKGITAGADYRFSDQLILGLAAGYASTNADLDANAGNLDADGWSVSLYGNYYPTEKLYIDGIASYGQNDYDQTRNIAYGLLAGGPRSATSSYGSDQYSLSLSAGYDLSQGALNFGGYGRLAYTKADIDGYQETGASGLDLAIESQSVKSLTTALGGRISQAFSTTKAVLIPQGWLEWIHEFKNDGRLIGGRFINDPSQVAFAVPTDSPDRDYFRIGVGLASQFAHGTSAFINYEGTLGLDNLTEHNFTAGVRFEF